MSTEQDGPEVQAGPVVKVARDLTEILAMTTQLDDQAEHKANARIDGTGLPGGLAMVALAGVANLEAWEAQFEARERFGRDHDHVEDEDDSWEPPLQTLCFWSEQWRAIHGAEYDVRPTVASEAAFIRWALNWAWDNEVQWDDFAADIRSAKARLENVLYAGERAERGAPCLYDECRGARLVRKLTPKRGEDGEKVWDYSDWHCPKCKRAWDTDRYQSNVAAAAWAAQSEEIDGEVWCSVKYAARQVDRPESTIRVWQHRGHLATICIAAGRRAGFVRLADVIARHENATRRGSAA